MVACRFDPEGDVRIAYNGIANIEESGDEDLAIWDYSKECLLDVKCYGRSRSRA